MLNLAEYRKNFAHLADFLPWAALVDPGIVLNKDGSLQRTARFRGPDLDSSVASELSAVSQRLNSAFRRLGDRWALFIEAQREPSAVYADSQFPDAASALVDAERKAAFENTQAHFESNYFLTLLYLPSEDATSRGESWLFEGQTKSGLTAVDHLDQFRDQTDRILKLLDGFMPQCAWLDDVETLTYLHSTISTNRQRVTVPETPMHLDVLLADQPLTGGLSPRLGASHLRILTITGFPGATTPGILDELNRLAFPYRWSTRAVLMDKTAAVGVVSKIRRQWFSKRKSMGALMKEVMTNESSALVDNDATNKATDADAALQELGGDYAGLAYVTATIVVWDDDLSLADEKQRLVEKVIQSRDFTCIRESLNAVDAWLGTIPGQVYANVRQPPVSTLNLAHLMPVSALWAGDLRDEHFRAPALLQGRAQGSTPFRLSLHVGDVGHTLVIGPTGAGKSVLLALMALQFRRYAGAQIFAFDFGRSMRAAALAMKGDWYDLGAPESANIRLQPLAQIDDLAERGWAADWIMALLSREGIATDPETKDFIWSALTSLASAPVEERTLTGLLVLLQSQRIKQALQTYCLSGAHGTLLDGDRETLGSRPVQVFEIQGLVGTAAAPAVLSYLFHRIEAQLDGRPTLIVIDEGWLALDDPAFAAKIKEWLKTLRKANASVLFATQSLADIHRSSLAPILIESCPTRLFLPNANALEPQITSIYRQFGLNDRQIQILARAIPKREYYLQSPRGDRLFELGLDEVALALCATSSKDDQAAIDSVLRETPDDFLSAWLRSKRLAWAADLIPTLTNLEN